jgi:hypothetical protein
MLLAPPSLALAAQWVILFLAGSAGAAPILDQSFATNNPNLGNVLNEGSIFTSQTSFATRSGNLVRADVFFGRGSSTTTNPWLVTINSCNALGAPTGTILASQTIPAASVPTSSGFNIPPVVVDFTTPAHLNAGQQFGITVSIIGGSGSGNGGVGSWAGRSGNEYTGGNVYNSNDGTNYNLYIGDLYFNTYIDVPEPGAGGAIAVAMAAGLLRRRR